MLSHSHCENVLSIRGLLSLKPNCSSLAAKSGFFMAVAAVKRNRRLNLLIPRSLADRLEEELMFLGLNSRTVIIEERAIGTRNDFLRLIVSQYTLRCLEGAAEAVELDEETVHIPFYLDRSSEGFWDTAIQDGIANSYNELASQALYDYFARQESVASAIAKQAAFYQQMLQDVDISQWRKEVAA